MNNETDKVIQIMDCDSLSETSKEETVTKGKYFRMGAAVAIAELVHSGELYRNSSLRKWAKGYLASFGITSMRDVSDLGIKGVYKYDFEILYL